MAKKKSALFECQSCGLQSGKWMGKCPNCGAWESFIELSNEQIEAIRQSSAAIAKPSKAIPITQVEEQNVRHFTSGDGELDLVLGGGIVPGSLILVGGSPGIGKSTLLLKIAGNLAHAGQRVLYVTGEESGGQIKLRANRLEANHERLMLLTEIRLEGIQAEIYGGDYSLVIIDSIQTLYSETVPSAPGSVTQVRTITFELMRLAKEREIAVFIIGHITKEGSIAGPRVLEHMVDTVLYFEGDSSKEIRMLRGFKNRFGSTSEIGIFEMTPKGLISAKNIASRFFSKGKEQAGSAVTVIMEGSRPLVIEVQALVSDSGYGNPKRSTTGYDGSRLTMLLALLEKKLDLPFNQYDVFVNIAGGIKIVEPAADLAVIAAIISSFRNRPISHESVFIGEVSLIGDIRDVYMLENRLKEAQTLGFTKAIIPSKPTFKTPLKCFIADEVAKVVDWM